jgi:hypothetical protein
MTWTACTNSNYTSIRGGYGGGGGTTWGTSGGGGGGGGGVVFVGRHVRISGSVNANGGRGAPVVSYSLGCGFCSAGNGAGGGGGSIWIVATGVEVTGSMTVAGGTAFGSVAAGSAGTIRIDAREVSAGSLHYSACTVSGVPPLLEVTHDGSQWSATNFGTATRDTVLTVLQ